RHNPAPEAIGYFLDAPEDSSIATIGGGKEVASANLETLPVGGGPAPVTRVILPDLTGFYESVPDPGKDPAMMLQLNQAGHFVVAWSPGLRSFVPDMNRIWGRVPPQGQNQVIMEPGALVAFLGPVVVLPSEKVTVTRMIWMEQTPYLRCNMLDPDDLVIE